ncbi:MAG: hypothetical protein K2M83_14325 [Muribaculaceae bacterium]|nr:hypothetical protein [Muribaculaceae bacterium]
MKQLKKLWLYVGSFVLILLLMPLEGYAQKKAANVDYTKMSLATLKQKALSNNAEAQFEYGQRLRFGKNGLVKNEVEGLEWLRKAGKNGFDTSYFVLLYLLESKGEYEKRIDILREGVSVNSEECLFAMFEDYRKGQNGLPQSNEMARNLLLKGCDLKMPKFFSDRYLAHRYEEIGFKKDKDSEKYWLKRDCDNIYNKSLTMTGDYKEIAIQALSRHLKVLKDDYGCVYEPSLHIKEYLAWLKEKDESKSSTKPSNSYASTSLTSTTSKSDDLTYQYTKSGRGQSQNTGQWTDEIGSEEYVVQFTEDGISVNGIYQPYVKTCGVWKVYGGTSMRFGGSNTTFYYYVDSNKNMKQVCESSFPYGFDTFVYPMSRNGDPTPMRNNVNNGGYVNSTGTTNNFGTGSTTQPARQFKCAYCNGKGRIERNDNAPASFGITKANKKCNECGKIYDPTVFNHYHVQCGHCGGTGNAK